MSDGPAIPSYGGRRAMPAENFLDQVGAIDLDGQMRRVQPDFARELERDREQVVAIAATMLDDAHRPFLEWILDITLRKPVFLPNLGPQSVAYCALREGQNQVAWMILQAIAEGRTEMPPHREGL